MAKVIVERDQQADIRRRYPKPAYSRVVSFFLSVMPDGEWHYATTPPLGNKIWLLRATVRHIPRVVSDTNFTYYELMSGDAKANTLSDIGKWNFIIPNIADGGMRYVMVARDGQNEYTEEMLRLYTGVSRRFGIIAKRIGVGEDHLFVSFLISEG